MDEIPAINRALIYFGIQVKREILDAKAGAGDTNTAIVLSQPLMDLDREIFDPDINRDVLIDHIYIISAGEITKAAKNWLGGKLDASKRKRFSLWTEQKSSITPPKFFSTSSSKSRRRLSPTTSLSKRAIPQSYFN
jgi:hypothetical protein